MDVPVNVLHTIATAPTVHLSMKIYSAGIIRQLMTTIRMLALMIMRSTSTTTFVHLHLRHEWSEHLYTPINVYLFVIFYCLLEEVEIDVFMEFSEIQ